MADETPPTSADPINESDKSETVRITLPSKTEGPVAKRETVRINIPESTGNAPKKETSKVTLPSGSAAVPPPPMSRPSAPPMPPPLSKPASGMTSPPKPPPLSGRPTIPLRPGPSGAVPPAGPGASGIVAKPSTPKKETARISLPSDAPKSSAPALPKATVKMQQTQPLMKSMPPQASGIQQPSSASGIRRAPGGTSLAPVISTAPAKADTLSLVLSILAFVAAVAAGVFSYLVFTAATLPEWVK